MKLHIVGGFLGSGKTTAIKNAAKVLTAKDQKVGIITNDQGGYPEDTSFVNANYSPADEVINGCFSSNFDSLSDKIASLNQDLQPDYIFAESVGSCTDLVATVLKPLMIFNKSIFESVTLSIFVDVRLLISYLKGDKLLFGDDVTYIFGKQIEEADLLIINKIDLLGEADFPTLKRLVDNKLKDKIMIISQNSFNPQNIDNWLNTINSLPSRKRESLVINYQSYGKGEADLTWLDEEISFTSSKTKAGEFAIRFIESVMMDIKQKQIPIGHIKFMLVNGEQAQKISFTAIYDEDWKKNLLPVSSNLVKLMMNARIESTQDMIRTIIQNGIAFVSNNEVKVVLTNTSARPSGVPIPGHHNTNAIRCCEECICLKKLLARNAIRIEDGSSVALSELEVEEFECNGVCSEGEGCCC